MIVDRCPCDSVAILAQGQVPKRVALSRRVVGPYTMAANQVEAAEPPADVAVPPQPEVATPSPVPKAKAKGKAKAKAKAGGEAAPKAKAKAKVAPAAAKSPTSGPLDSFIRMVPFSPLKVLSYNALTPTHSRSVDVLPIPPSSNSPSP